MLKKPEELLSDLINSGIVESGDIGGCTEAEISELETTFRVSLPESYKHFLRVMGKDIKRDGFYASYLMFDIVGMDTFQLARKDAAESLKYFDYVLKPSNFVCLYTDATFCGWFDTTAGADPSLNLATEMNETVQFAAYPIFCHL